MRRFQDSVKALEADIQHANALASEFLREYDGSVIQMRMAYSAVAHFLVQWTDCKLAGALGLLKIMIYKVFSLVGYPRRGPAVNSRALFDCTGCMVLYRSIIDSW